MRLANVNDADHIHKLICCTYSDPKRMASLLANPAGWERITLPEVHEKMKCGQFLVGVEHDTRINNADADYYTLGVCVFIDMTSTTHLTEMNCLAVHPELQGSSLSLAVLDAAFAHAHEAGYTHVESDVLSVRPHLVSTQTNKTPPPLFYLPVLSVLQRLLSTRRQAGS